MKRIGILTSGGDCQGLNSAIRGVAKGLYEHYGKDVEIYGIQDGYRGLIHGEYKLMKRSDFSGILTIGGTILGTSRQPFKMMREIEEDNVDKVHTYIYYKKMKLDCLVVLGGNGTHKTANLLSEEGLNVVSMPKTIDNDVWGTDMTFGFHSAVEIATNVIDCIHTTATSHGRIFIVEVMGHKVGWLTLEAGIAGGADVILLPEIPYDVDKIAKVLKRPQRAGKLLLHSGSSGRRHFQAGSRYEQEGVQGGPCQYGLSFHFLSSGPRAGRKALSGNPRGGSRPLSERRKPLPL